MIKKIFVMLIALCSMSIAANAQNPTLMSQADVDTFNKGVDARNAENYALAVSYFRPLAEKGFGPAQYEMGKFYYNGWAVPQDIKLFAEWIKKSCESGWWQGYMTLGMIYHEGLGLPRDFAESHKWYLKAAIECEDTEAMYNIGMNYHAGEGVNKDLVQAKEWYRKAAEMKHPDAANNLAHLYEQSGDYTNAVKYWKIGTDGGNDNSQYALAICYLKGEHGCEKNAQLAIQLLKKAADQGHMRALQKLSELGY